MKKLKKKLNALNHELTCELTFLNLRVKEREWIQVNTLNIYLNLKIVNVYWLEITSLEV